MGLNPTTPETQSVEVKTTEDKALDTYHIHEMLTKLNPNDPTQNVVELQWSKGYMDGETYVPIQFDTATISGTDLGAKFMEVVPEDRTLYDAVKYGCWEMLLAKGLVPEGSIA